MSPAHSLSSAMHLFSSEQETVEHLLAALGRCDNLRRDSC